MKRDKTFALPFYPIPLSKHVPTLIIENHPPKFNLVLHVLRSWKKASKYWIELEKKCKQNHFQTTLPRVPDYVIVTNTLLQKGLADPCRPQSGHPRQREEARRQFVAGYAEWCSSLVVVREVQQTVGCDFECWMSFFKITMNFLINLYQLIYPITLYCIYFLFFWEFFDYRRAWLWFCLTIVTYLCNP